MVGAHIGFGRAGRSRYGQQLLAALHANLNRKAAQQFKHQRELQAVFLLNNVHYIHRTLQQSPTLKRQVPWPALWHSGVIQLLCHTCTHTKYVCPWMVIYLIT